VRCRPEIVGLSLAAVRARATGPGAYPSPYPLPPGEGSPRRAPTAGDSAARLSPLPETPLSCARSARPRGLSRGIVRPGGVAVSVSHDRRGSWRRRPVRRRACAREACQAAGRTGHREPRAGRGGGPAALPRHLDIDIDTRRQTAAPSRPAHPLGYAKRPARASRHQPAGILARAVRARRNHHPDPTFPLDNLRTGSDQWRNPQRRPNPRLGRSRSRPRR
jgi:hypothetical protein